MWGMAQVCYSLSSAARQRVDGASRCCIADMRSLQWLRAHSSSAVLAGLARTASKAMALGRGAIHNSGGQLV